MEPGLFSSDHRRPAPSEYPEAIQKLMPVLRQAQHERRNGLNSGENPFALSSSTPLRTGRSKPAVSSSNWMDEGFKITATNVSFGIRHAPARTFPSQEFPSSDVTARHQPASCSGTGVHWREETGENSTITPLVRQVLVES
jgi:hypothetical protein